MKEKPFSKYQILANAVMIIWTLAIILPFILLFMSLSGYACHDHAECCCCCPEFMLFHYDPPYFY